MPQELQGSPIRVTPGKEGDVLLFFFMFFLNL